MYVCNIVLISMHGHSEAVYNVFLCRIFQTLVNTLTQGLGDTTTITEPSQWPVKQVLCMKMGW